MAAKRTRSTEEARRGIQGGVDKRANAARVTRGPTEGDIAWDKQVDALCVPWVGRTGRKMAPPVRHYWPSPDAQRVPSRPQGSKKSPKK